MNIIQLLDAWNLEYSTQLTLGQREFQTARSIIILDKDPCY